MILDILFDDAPPEQIQKVKKTIIDVSEDRLVIVSASREDHIALELVRKITVTND